MRHEGYSPAMAPASSDSPSVTSTTTGIDFRQALVRAAAEIGPVDRADAGKAADGEQHAQHAARQAEQQHLRHVLADDVAAAGAERPPQSRERRGVQELGEQQAHDVDQAHAEEHQRDADQHAVVLLHDLVAVEPLLDVVQHGC